MQLPIKAVHEFVKTQKQPTITIEAEKEDIRLGAGALFVTMLGMPEDEFPLVERWTRHIDATRRPSGQRSRCTTRSSAEAIEWYGMLAET